MNTVLWVLQIYIAILFIYSGIMKSTQKRERLVSIGQTGVADLSYPFIRSIGVLEIAGVLGITIPWATNILPVLTPVSAACFAIIMALAAPIHYRRREYKSVFGVNLTTFIICLFIAYMRLNELSSV